MHSIVVVVTRAILTALCRSAVWYWRRDASGATSMRRRAAVSTVITIVIFVLIYATSFTHHALAVLHDVPVSGATVAWFSDALTSFNHFVTDIVTGLHPASADPYTRLHPPAWPLAMLCIYLAIQFLIYHFYIKSGHTKAGVIGSAYWAHIMAFGRLLTFAIVILDWSPWLVVPLSMATLAVFVVCANFWLRDLSILSRAAARLVWLATVEAARWVSYIAVEIGAFVRAWCTNTRTPQDC